MVRQWRGGHSMTDEFYALLGLTEPKIHDPVIGTLVPFKLSEAEYEFILTERIGERLANVLVEARSYFATYVPSGKVYHKRSRWTPTAKLYVLDIKPTLDALGCRHESNSYKINNKIKQPQHRPNSNLTHME